MLEITELRRQLQGVMVATVTPFCTDFSIDWDAVDENLEFLVDSEVTAVIPCGSIGEFPSLTSNERKALVARTVGTVRQRTLVIAGTSDEDMAVAIELTNAAKEAGVDGVMVKVPHYFGLMDEEVVRFFSDIDEVGCPFIVYNNPTASKHNISLETMERLSSLRHFVGLKEAGNDVIRFYRMLRRFGSEFPVTAGAENPVFFNLLAGSPACLTATGAFSPYFMWALFNAVQSGNLEVARALQHRLWSFREQLLQRAELGHPAYITYTKAAMEILGLPAGPPRLPLLPLNNTEWQRLRETLANEMGLGARGELIVPA